MTLALVRADMTIGDSRLRGRLRNTGYNPGTDLVLAGNKDRIFLGIIANHTGSPNGFLVLGDSINSGMRFNIFPVGASPGIWLQLPIRDYYEQIRMPLWLRSTSIANVITV